MNDSITSVHEKVYTDVNEGENDFYQMTPIEKSLNTYFFIVNDFGWINCNRFYNDIRARKDLVVTFILPEKKKNSAETYNYIIFDSLMSVIPLYKADSGRWVCPNLPLGEAITCISIQQSGFHIYYGIQKTHVGDWALTVNMHEIQEQELEKVLDLTL